MSASLEGGHDVIYDYSCTQCASDNLNAEASFYCKDCSKLFCGVCLEHHERRLKGHKVLGKDKVKKWGSVRQVTPAVQCDEHGRESEMYCADHDCVCCHVCVDVRHRACKDVKHVPDIAAGILRKEEFKSLHSTAANTQTRLINLEYKRKNNLKLLQKGCDDIRSTIKTMRKKMNETLDKLEKESIEEMEKLQNILKNGIQSDIDSSADILVKIQRLLDDLQKHGNNSETFAFQAFKKCLQKLADADKLLKYIQPDDYQIQFNPDLSCNKLLASLKPFGEFHVTPGFPSSGTDHAFTVASQQTYNVKTKSDDTMCSISGISRLPDGPIALVDNGNSKIKLLNPSTFSVISELKLPPAPFEICHTSGTDMAVTVCLCTNSQLYRSKVQFVKVEHGKLVRSKTFKLRHECRGIAYHNGQLYVGSANTLYLYSMSGEQISKLYEDKTCVCRFCLSDNVGTIYITNFDKHLLITLYRSGQLQSEFSSSKLEKPVGVCTADNGTIFVSGQDSCTILQVDGDGRRELSTVATHTDGIKQPRSLCYDKTTRQLIAGQRESDKIVVFELK